MYDYMCLHFEDCIDALQALYPEFNTVWLFNHSCGHDRGRGDGLSVANMRVNWGGKQSRVRDKRIKEEFGYLGPRSPLLKVDDTQRMIFQEINAAPYSMSPINRDLHHYDEVEGKKVKNRLKHDFCEDLQRLRFNTRGKTIKEVQELATSQNIPITVEENDIVEGWVGNPKGMRQVLW